MLIDPAVYVPSPTPTPITFDPTRWPLRFLRSSQLNSFAPISRASRRWQLVKNVRLGGAAPFALAAATAAAGGGGPNCNPVDGALILRIST